MGGHHNDVPPFGLLIKELKYMVHLLAMNGVKRVLGIGLCVVFLAIGLSACGSGTPAAPSQTSPLATMPVSPAATVPLASSAAQVEERPTPSLPSSDPYRSFTAADSFAPAYTAAKAWREDAQWYGVVPFTSVSRFFALPFVTDRPSWYFRFGAAAGEEYLVEVLDGQVVGTNELVIPAYIESPLSQLDPLGDTWAVLDSEAAITTYREHKDSWLKTVPSLLLDYRLVNPSDRVNPVWMLYNAQSVLEPVFVMDAVTGEAIPLE